MPIVLNGTTFNNGGTATYNGQTVKEIIFNTTTVWKAETPLFPSSYTWTGLQSGGNAGSGSVTSSAMTITARSNGGWKFQCNTSIDFSQYNTMNITYTVTNTHSASTKYFAFQTADTAIWSTSNDFWYTTNQATGSYTQSIDVSSLTTSFKPIFGVHAYTGSGTFSVVISSITLS